jgi:hypothetical protein
VAECRELIRVVKDRCAYRYLLASRNHEAEEAREQDGRPGVNLSLRKQAWLLLLVAAGAPPIPSGAQQDGVNGVSAKASPQLRLNAVAADVTPADVYARLSRVRGDIEIIRFVMGKPKVRGAEIALKGVAPREVYFQAFTMLRKANRLSFEQTREVAPTLQPLAGDTDPGDVLAVVNAAFERISHVKAWLDITRAPAPQELDASKTPTDVFGAIVQANRQLNLLLDEKFAPSDVFQQVTLAIGYATRLRARFPGDRIPEAPELVVGKQPRDVYQRLVGCFSVIREIAAISGLGTLELQTSADHLEHVTPSDVYDIASLLVSELAYIHAQLDGAKSPRQVYDPGRKFPSDVDQRAGILEAQLLELRRLVDTHPDWLREPRAGR